MAHIIPLHGDPHAQVQALLPWYANGTLEPDEAAHVEAHLADCAECRAELEAERALGQLVASLPVGVESGWAALREQMEQRPASPPPLRLVRGGFLARPVPVGWAIAAQAAMLLLVVGITRLPATRPAPYQALSSAPAARTGNAIVIFRPETSEAELRGLLQRSGARLVDGPTASNAWLLYVPVEQRGTTLTGLRATGKVLLAEPLDGAAQ